MADGTLTTTPFAATREAELAVLGGVLFRASLLDYAARLTKDHFADKQVGWLFGAAARAIRAGEPMDATILSSAVPKARALVMEAVAQAAVTGARVAEYQDTILEQWQRREVQARARQLIEQVGALAPHERATDLIAVADQDLLRLGAARSRRIITAREAWARVEESLHHEIKPKAAYGLSALDKTFGGLFAPDLIILAGRPGMGKTSLAANIAVNAARSGARVHFASLEMDADQIVARVGARSSGKFSPGDIRRPDKRPRPDDVAGVAQDIPETLAIDEAGGISVVELEAACRDTQALFGGLDLIVVDYLQLMEGGRSRGKNDSRVQEVTEITKGLKQLAKRLQVPIIALSQLSRAVENRDDKRPQLSDLRESGSIEQDADAVLFAYREAYYLERDEPKQQPGESKSDFDIRWHGWMDQLEAVRKHLDVIVGKNRHGASGATLKLLFDAAHDRVEDWK